MPLKKSGGPIVGLDIGSAFIKACEIDCKGGRANLRGIAILKTPSDAVANNEIVDPVALGKTIKRALQEAGIKSKRTICSVSGQSSLVVRIIEVPKMSRAELKDTMRWEVERHVPFAAEQVVTSYHPLVEPEDVPEGQNMEVLLAVAQEAMVTRHLETLKAAGLQTLAIDIEPLAVSRALMDISNGQAPTGTVGVVNVGASSTDVSIYKNGNIAFTRSIQIAGNNLTKAIADNLGKPLGDAEDLKLSHGRVPEAASQAGGDTMFEGEFGGLGPLDFGVEAEPAGFGALGGTFGSEPDPGASTASDTHSDSTFDVAGSGFGAEAFAAPAGAAPFAMGGSPALVAGPVPGGNPFDPGATEAQQAGGSPFDAPAGGGFGGNPFGGGGESLFGAAPVGSPFGGGDLPGFAADPGATGVGQQPAQPVLTEEELLQAQVADAIIPVLNELVTELRRSLDFYRNRANGLGAQQIILTGGSARLPGLVPFLTTHLETPVSLGDPLQYVAAGPKASTAFLSDNGPAFPVAVGLAVRELLVEEAAPKSKKSGRKTK